MAVRWSSEYFTAVEHRDLQANAMALDNTGTYVLLAGRRYIAIRNLDAVDSDNVRKFPRQSKYEVGAAEWNPTSHHSELCVISSNQRLEVLTWRVGELTQTHSLRAHTRVITDLNCHRTDPNILASCSVDTFIHIWDLRDSRKPASSLSAVAEASQVRWNRVSPHLLATTHDGDIKLWDQRKGTAPIQYIAAHLSKIHGLDWNPHNETQLATSSQDNTVKFFDINNPRRAEFVLTTNAPVWRARFTPFGNGLVTVVVPQLRRGENSLLLWNTANRTTPVYTFVGHRDVVLEFEWRKQRQDETDFQLVTWSKDQTLLVWRIEPFLQKLCGHEPDDGRGDEIDDVTSEKSFNKYVPKVQPLQQEFSLLNVHIPNLEVNKMDIQRRCCTVTASANKFFVILQVTFPNAYPNGVPPVFQISPESKIDETVTAQLIQTLTHTAQQHVLKNRTCLEPCLRQFVTTLEQLDSSDVQFYQPPYLEHANVLGSFNDAYIPFPKTCGAKFCSVSVLVCFSRPVHAKRITMKSESTPRALTAIAGGFTRTNENVSVSSFYFQKQRSRNKLSNAKIQKKAVVTIYDAANLFLVNRHLAEKYILDGDIDKVCRHNATVAAGVGRSDLVQAWTLAEFVASSHQIDRDISWTTHPFGGQLIQSLINHYALQFDLQMAAMLSCVFGKDQLHRKPSINSILSSTAGGSPYHTIPPTDSVSSDASMKHIIKSMLAQSLENIPSKEQKLPIIQLNSSKNSLYEYYKLMYAEILHRWGLLYSKAEVLKYLCRPEKSYKGVQFFTDCQHCLTPTKSCNCYNCKNLSLNCVICHISVRGSANCCIVCGHGGHTQHLQQWFAKNKACPSGCGCYCLNETADLFSSS